MIRGKLSRLVSNRLNSGEVSLIQISNHDIKKLAVLFVCSCPDLLKLLVGSVSHDETEGEVGDVAASRAAAPTPDAADT